jgi:tetratricopeptide (TPR) repeat protein
VVRCKLWLDYAEVRSMKYRKLLIFLPMLLLVLASCSRDPKVRAQRYVENGNKFFARGKYKEASLMYRNAMKQDARFGEAYYRLALTDMKLYAYGDAFRALLRTVELQPNNTDAKTKLADLYLLAALQDPKHAAESVDNASDLAAKLLKQDPKSFEGHRIKGRIAMLQRRDLPAAIVELQAANDSKPLQSEVVTPYFQALTASNRFPEAETLAYQMIAKDKTFSPMYDLLYLEYYRRNRPADSERVLKLKSANNPKSTRYMLELATFYIVTKRRPDADAIFKQMTEGKDFPDGHLLVGDFYFFRLREFDHARAEYEAAINAYPKDKALYQKRLVELLAITGHSPEANQLLAGVIKDNPKDSDAIAMRAGLMLLTGNRDQIDQAAIDLQSLVTKAPDNPVLRFNLARALRAKGDVQQAILQLEAALKIRPDFMKARELLATLYLRTGDNPKALKAADDIIERDKNNVQGHLVRSAALMTEGERDQSRKELEFLVKTYPQNVEARYQVAYLDFVEKNYKAAAEEFGKLNQEYPKDHRGLVGVTETLAAENRMPDAIKEMEKAIQAEPDRRDLKLDLANFEVRAEQYDPAIAVYKGLLDKEPKNGDLLFRLAETYRRKGDLNASIEKFRESSQASPTEVRPLLQLALLMDGTGRQDQSQPIYEQVLKIQPDNPVALNNLAYLKAERGIDLDQAQTMAQRARQRSPNSPEIADTLGWIYIKRNLSEEAVRVFQDLVAKDPKNAKFHYHYGMALYEKGDKPSTKRELLMALQDNPSKDDEAKIRDLLAKL